MVVGGSDGENVLGDVWLLDVDKGTWTEVSVHIILSIVIQLYRQLYTCSITIATLYRNLCLIIILAATVRL